MKNLLSYRSVRVGIFCAALRILGLDFWNALVGACLASILLGDD